MENKFQTCCHVVFDYHFLVLLLVICDGTEIEARIKASALLCETERILNSQSAILNNKYIEKLIKNYLF